MAPGPIGAKAKNIQRIVWMPIGQPIPRESEIFSAFARSGYTLRQYY